MKRVSVNAYQVALVFENGSYIRMLAAGRYWVKNCRQVRVFDITRLPDADLPLAVLLEDPLLAARMQVIDVQDGQLALHFEDGRLIRVLIPGRHAVWKSMIEHTFLRVDRSDAEITADISREVLAKAVLAPYVRRVEVENYEKALLFKDGRFQKVLGPGVYYWWNNQEDVRTVKTDMRIQQMEINGQEILTRDKAALRVNAWIRYRVTDPEKAFLVHKDCEKQLYVACQLSIRERIGALTLDALLDEKAALGSRMAEGLSPAALAMGLELLGFGIRDMILPGEVKTIMNQVLIAEKKALAGTILRREEAAGMRSLLNTARLMEGSAVLSRLREMEHVEKIAEKISYIAVNGNGAVGEQLRQLLIPKQE